ncbi:MAG: hypothetical protein KC438_12310, partial [Thermomicrobiales bacterium]|nr:hypothetical protein [Thermomicrobiales bacterium]
MEGARSLSDQLEGRLRSCDLATPSGQRAFAERIAEAAIHRFSSDADCPGFMDHLATVVLAIADYEGWFTIPRFRSYSDLSRAELWEMEDQLKRVEAILDHQDEATDLASGFLAALIEPLIQEHPRLLENEEIEPGSISFEANLRDLIQDIPEAIEQMMQIPFAPELEPLALTTRLRERIEYNLAIASGGVAGDPDSARTPKLPTKQSSIPAHKLPEAYLGGTPIPALLDYQLPVSLPQRTRFEHMHIVAGSGHGKTQTLQHLILHDLDAVAGGQASIIVIDSQSDLINNIAGLKLFSPGQPLADRLVLIDPTDLEWPVALNLFDVGMDRLDSYSQLDRERLTNSILELYDFVLGSLLDAGLTQKQNVIFRYITRLLLHVPNATIHTLRELLEEGGGDRYSEHIAKLQGSARAFFEHEFNGKEFAATKRQVLRRLYGILENQTFERMFSHPK